MAVTAIWPIKGRVDKVIAYARNPEKTQESSHEELSALHAIEGVVEYAADDIKTERRSYVSCVNLLSEVTAAQEFISTKRLMENSTAGPATMAISHSRQMRSRRRLPTQSE